MMMEPPPMYRAPVMECNLRTSEDMLVGFGGATGTFSLDLSKALLSMSSEIQTSRQERYISVLPLNRMWSLSVSLGQSARLTSERETKYWNLGMVKSLSFSL